MGEELARLSEFEPASDNLDCGIGLWTSQATFPDHCEPPSGAHEFFQHALIAFPAPLELSQPNHRSRGGHLGVSASLVTMPEAAVNHYDGAVVREHQIGWTLAEK